MRIIAISVLLFFVTACSRFAEPSHSGSVTEDTKVAAVIMYADWCSSCKALDPKLQAVRARGDIDGVEYIVLDYTNKDIDGLMTAADAAGVGVAVRNRFGGVIRTGSMLLVNARTNELLGEITYKLSEDEIETAIKSAVLKS